MNLFRMWRPSAGMLTVLLVVIAAALPVEAKEKDRCEGTKKQRRQKMELIKTLVYEARTQRGWDAEFRFMAIPDDALRNEAEDMFDKDYMIEMEDYGRTLGADPSNWKSEIPSAFWQTEN